MRTVSKENLFSYEEKQKFINVNLTNYYNYFYYGIIYGGPTKNSKDWRVFEINFDTGSDMLWLPSKKCSGCPNKNKYEP